MDNGALVVPDNPIIPFIEGDGIGIDITPAMIDVVDNAVKLHTTDLKRFHGWKFTVVRNQPKFTAKILGFQMNHRCIREYIVA